MKPEQILEFIQNYLPTAMMEIEQSRLNGKLQYALDILMRYKTEKEILNIFNLYSSDLYFGMTTSPYMELIPFFKKWGYKSNSKDFYCLKNNMKASDALDDLLKNSITVIDCILAIQIAWYLCIRALLIKCHGEIAGKAKFNDLFDGITVKFVITPYDVCGVIGQAQPEAFFSINSPLNYFVDILPCSTAAKMKASDDCRIQIGDALSFDNHKDYSIKKPAEPDGAMQSLCVNKDKYVAFGLGIVPLSEMEILQYFVNSYNKPSFFEQHPEFNSIRLAFLTKNIEFIGKVAPQIGLDQVQGYNVKSLRRLNIEKLLLLINDFNATKENMKQFIASTDQLQRDALMSREHHQRGFDIVAVLEESIMYYKAHLKLLKVFSPEYIECAKNLYLTTKNLAFIYYADKKDFKNSITLYREAAIGYQSLNLIEDAMICNNCLKRSEDAQRDLELAQKRPTQMRDSSPHKDKLQQITGVIWKKYAPENKPLCYLFQTSDLRKAETVVNQLDKNKISAHQTKLADTARPEQKAQGEFVVKVNQFSL